MQDNINAITTKQNVHFTYKSDPDRFSLCQGDLLCRTDALLSVLKKVHPYFLREEYKYFMVLSQSCDLVRRTAGECKTPYITLAAVREYSDFLERILVANKLAEECNGFLFVNEKNRQRVTQLVERIYNNTESDYFFLYKEDMFGISKSMVTYLKVSIALKSKLHYQECLDAKVVELSDEFKAKLGWLVGNMYSRVGTTDWASKMNDKERKQMIEEDVNSRCIIGSKDQLNTIKERLQKAEGDIGKNDIVDMIMQIPVKSKYDQVMEIIENTFKTNCKNICDEDKEKLLNAIRSRSRIKQLIQ